MAVAGVYVPPHLRESGKEIIKRTSDRTTITTPNIATLTAKYERFQSEEHLEEDIIAHAKVVLPNTNITLHTTSEPCTIIICIDGMKLKIMDNVLTEQYAQRANNRCTIRYRSVLVLDLKLKRLDQDGSYQHVSDAVATFQRENPNLQPRTLAERLAERLRTGALEGRQFKLIVRESRRVLNLEQRTNHVIPPNGQYVQDQVTFVRLNLNRPLLEQFNELNLI